MDAYRTAVKVNNPQESAEVQLDVYHSSLTLLMAYTLGWPDGTSIRSTYLERLAVQKASYDPEAGDYWERARVADVNATDIVTNDRLIIEADRVNLVQAFVNAFRVRSTMRNRSSVIDNYRDLSLLLPTEELKDAARRVAEDLAAFALRGRPDGIVLDRLRWDGTRRAMIDPPWTKTSSSSRASACSTGTSRSTRRRCASAGRCSGACRSSAATPSPPSSNAARTAPSCSPGSSAIRRWSTGRGSCWSSPPDPLRGTTEPVDALRRELIEELGYEAGPLEPIATFYVTPGGSSERVFLYATQIGDEDRVGDGGGLASEGEAIEIVAVSVDELLAMVADGTIEDAKTIIGAWWLERRRDGS